MSDFQYLDPDCQGWHRAWAVLHAARRIHGTDPSWQYMGTAVERVGEPPAHSFRSKELPDGVSGIWAALPNGDVHQLSSGAGRVYLRVPIEASDFDPV